MPGSLKNRKFFALFKKLKVSLALLVILLASVVIFSAVSFMRISNVRLYKAAILEFEGYEAQNIHRQISQTLDSAQISIGAMALAVFIFLPSLIYSVRRTVYNGLEFYRKTQSDELEHVLFDFAPVLMTVFDKNLNVIECNDEGLRRFGFKNKEDFASNFFAASTEFQPDGTPSEQKGRELLQKCLQEGYVRFYWTHRTLPGEGRPYEEIPTDVIGFRVKYQNQDVMLTYATDLRQLKKLEKEKTEEAERVMLMFEHTPLFIEYWDGNFKCVDSNRRAVELYDLADKEEYIERWEEFFPEFQKNGQKSTEYWEVFLHGVLNEGHGTCEFIGKRKDGSPVFFDVSGFRTKFGGKNAVITYASDTSELKKSLQLASEEKLRLEAAEANSRIKNRFLAGISHEIRTPISAVLGISEIQLRGSLAMEQEEAFAKIYSAANSLLGIVNDLLDLSKIEAGKMVICNEAYDTGSLLNDVVQLNLASSGSKGIEFIIDIDENLPSTLIGDELRLKQVLNNLLSNAFKYTFAGFVRLKITVLPGGEEGWADLEIAISDSGAGMTDEQLHALFDEYSRFHENKIKVSKGTGLGMPITANLLRLMGGGIDVQSTAGKGTCVTVKIRQKAVGGKVLGKEAAAALNKFMVDSKSVLKKLEFVPEPMPYGHVLVVDDVETNLYVARGLLSIYKINVETCESGREAIRMIEEGAKFDIVFMDHTMPDLDGIETTKILRGMGYSQPIVALTANAQIGQAEEFLRNGFDGFVSKPIQMMHLDRVLTKFIRAKHEGAHENDAAEIDFSDFETDRGDTGEFEASEEMLAMIRQDFAESQKNVFEDITRELSRGGFETAYRLAHNLKNIAGLLNEKPLVKAAQDVESDIKKAAEAGSSLLGSDFDGRLEALSAEISRVMENVRSILDKVPAR